ASLRLSADGSLLVAGIGGGTIQLWDLRRIREQLRLLGLDWGPPLAPPVAPSGDGPLRVEVNPGELGRTDLGHTRTVDQVALSADGRLAVSASCDGTLRAWDVRTGKQLRCFRGHTHPAYAAAPSADGRR